MKGTRQWFFLTRRNSHRRLWYFVILALLVHGVLVAVITVRTLDQNEERELSSRFVKRRPLRQPVLRRQVERPFPVRPMQRSIQPFLPFTRAIAQHTPDPRPPELLAHREAVPLPPRPMGFPRGFPASRSLRSESSKVAVQAENYLDLGLELLDVEALDTGRHRALVVEDPIDRRKLKGFVHFSAVLIESVFESAANLGYFARTSAYSVDRQITYVPDWRHSANVKALQGLASEIEDKTGLKAAVDEDISLDASELLSSPFILLTSTHEFEPTEGEINNLGRYLTSGGFAYVEQVGTSVEGWTSGSFPELISLRHLVGRALASQGLREGKDWSFEPLTGEHPLFAAYYSLHRVPTNYWESTYSPPDHVGHSRHSPTTADIPPYVEGVHLNGRLVAIYSRQNYRDFWYRRPEQNFTNASDYVRSNFGDFAAHKPSSDPAIRFGINVVVFALTQEGSLARRYVRAR